MKALVLYMETGNGFKSPAVAISRELEAAGIEAKPVDFYKAIGTVRFDRFITDTWRMMLRREWVFTLLFGFSNFFYVLEVFWIQFVFRRRILAYIDQEAPDCIITTHFIPLYPLERLLGRGTSLPYRDQGKLRTLGGRVIPVFGYNSDVILSHNVYTSKLVKTYFVSTTVGLESMVRHGSPRDKLTLTGFPIDPKYRKSFGPVAMERAALGLADTFTVLLTFGGEGVGDWSLIRAVAEAGLPVQVVAVCGRNQALEQEIAVWYAQAPRDRWHRDFSVHVRGFTANLQDYLYCCDISAGKAGLNVVFESLYLKKPFMVLKAMTNERHCARWVVDQGYGWWPRGTEEALGLVRSALENPGHDLARIRAQLDIPPCEFGIDSMIRVVKETVMKEQAQAFGKVKAVFFDLAGTLCDIPIGESWENINVAGIENVLQELGVAEEDRGALVGSFIAEKKRLRKEAKTTLAEFEIRDQLRDFFRIHRPEFLSLSKEVWDRLEYLFIKPELDITIKFDDAPGLLEALKKKYPLYLLSNNVSRVLVEEIVRKTGLEGYFEKIFVSSEIGFRKPHEKFLAAVLAQVPYVAEECVMIGDRLTQDIEMANRFGLPSIHMAMVDHEDNQGADHIQGTVKVHTLGEILAHLKI